MLQIPDFVLNYLIENNHIGKTRTLVIGENYPSPNYSTTYFYRSIPSCPGGPALGDPGAFFRNLCNVLLVPHLNIAGHDLTEFERLNKFLDSGFLLIDAQQNLVNAIRPAALTLTNINDLMRTILLINPSNIIFLTNNNKPVIASLSTHAKFHLIANKIIKNILTGTQVFAFPSAPANPELFAAQINHARDFYFI